MAQTTEEDTGFSRTKRNSSGPALVRTLCRGAGTGCAPKDLRLRLTVTQVPNGENALG